MSKYQAFKYRTLTRFTQWLAHRLPNRLKYFVAIDVVAFATTGKYGNTIVPELTAMDAIQRFQDDKGIL